MGYDLGAVLHIVSVPQSCCYFEEIPQSNLGIILLPKEGQTENQYQTQLKKQYKRAYKLILNIPDLE